MSPRLWLSTVYSTSFPLGDGRLRAALKRGTKGRYLLDTSAYLCILLGEVPALTTPRSLDLAHLRSALWFHADARIDRFVTLDGSQEQAARELGLPV